VGAVTPIKEKHQAATRHAVCARDGSRMAETRKRLGSRRPGAAKRRAPQKLHKSARNISLSAGHRGAADEQRNRPSERSPKCSTTSVSRIWRTLTAGRFILNTGMLAAADTLGVGDRICFEAKSIVTYQVTNVLSVDPTHPQRPTTNKRKITDWRAHWGTMIREQYHGTFHGGRSVNATASS